MSSNLLHFIIIYFSIYNVQGAEPPRPRDGAQEYSQFLEATIKQLQDQVNVLSAKLDQQSDRSIHLEAQLATQSLQFKGLSTQLNKTKDDVAEIQNQSVPINFVYVQLSRQELPSTIWPTFTWLDVTHDYAGVFFRALGGGSENFGVTQAEDSPRLTEVRFDVVNLPELSSLITIFPNNQWSAGVSSGGPRPTNTHWRMSFKQSAGEVRPRNQAVRIWKRVA